MRRLASLVNILRAQHQRGIALVIGVLITAGGSIAVLPMTDGAYARAAPHDIAQVVGGPNLRFVQQPAPPPLPPIQQPGAFTQVPWGSTDLGEEILRFRIREQISPRSNVAVFEYVDQDGTRRLLTRASGRGLGHAERLIAKQLQDLRIPNENVLRIYSELEPCPNIPFGYCKKMITKGSPRDDGGDDEGGGGGGGGGNDPDPSPKPLGPFPNAKVFYNYEYGDTPESRDRGHKQLIERVERWQQQAQARASTAFQAPDQQGTAGGPLVDTVSDQAVASLGGIDFSTLELRYLADRNPGDSDSIQYAFTALPATGNQPTEIGLHAVNQASDSFFVWLTLPTSKFTVNLNPDEPSRIIDADFARTNAGRVLLEADLQLKKTVAQLIHPDTPLGAQFWEALAGAGDERCMSFRQWIVPAPAKVHENGEELYILDAPLSVKMETEYVTTRGILDDRITGCGQQDPSIDARNEAIFRTLILPHLEQAVNQAPEYAELRRVYLSRVAAEWFRDRNAQEPTTFAELIDRGDITPWVSEQPWSPREAYARYVESFTKGEFDITRETQEGNTIWTTRTVFGGVDFTDIAFDNVSASDFQKENPDLFKTVEQAFDHAATDQNGTIWLGSTSGEGSGSDLSPYLSFVMIGAVGAIAIAVRVRSARRLRRARQDWASRGSPPAS